VSAPDIQRPTLPRLGLGTWNMGDGDRERTAQEIAALRLGHKLGMTLVDTAEMYGNGRSERLVGEAIAPYRACAGSLARLGTDRIDLYLLHWRGGEDLEAVVETFAALRKKGDILHWGVSNFDTDDLEELAALPGGADCATNQVLYNPEARGIEWDLIPACAARAMPVMAYSPVGQGGDLLRHPAMLAVATRHGVTPAAVALAWAIRTPGVVAIPKASDPAHVRDNAAAATLALDDDDLRRIDAAFPPPRRKRPLAML
jgi:diketogulonate reductase-like aldo/keto reductase